MRLAPQGDIPIDDIILSQRGSRFGSSMISQDSAISKTLAPTQDGNMSGNAESLKESNEPKAVRPLQGGNTPENTERSGWKIITSVFEYLWMLWLAGTLVLSVRKITVYQGYAKYIKAGCREVADIALLDQLAQEEVWAGVKRPVELYVNNLVSSPMLLGFFHPCIILPTTDLPRDEFLCTVRHELIHYRRRDMFYKWLVQITICLHWFNPLVYLMGRELNRACELSCDEAVIRSLDEPGRRIYGDTLLHAVGTEERYG
ncbi:MAG: M56 family metallopeptidase, partial [Acetatifactor sp.]|nr:M56 family metallopeptidase [Acetatifactor sp.]